MHEQYDYSKHLSFEATKEAAFQVRELPALYNRYGYGSFDDGGSIREQVPDKKVLCRVDQDTGDLSYLSTVGDKYKVIPNADILQTIHAQMIEHFGTDYFNSGEDAVKIRVTLAKNGAQTFIEYVFPRLTVDIETTSGHRTSLKYRQLYKNTFDGSSAFMLYVGNIDTFCWNGLISGQYSLLKETHRGLLNIGNFADKFKTTLDNYKETSRIYQRMAQAEVKHGVAGTIFDRMVYGNDRNKWPEQTRLSDHLRSLYLNERETRGWNIYSMMSAMTSYAKNGIRSGSVKTLGDQDAGRFAREQRVQRWMNSQPWTELCERSYVLAA